MIVRNITRLRRTLWTWRQPLTRLPASAASTISDLFVWRSSDEWQTFFELIDISSLFEDDEGERYVNLIFFDRAGRRVLEQRIKLQAYCRQTLDISALVGRTHGESGTFAVFHTRMPSSITKLGSFLAERGYVSYCYRGAPLRAYVHGNLDAMSLGADGKLQLLGGVGLLRREYNLQHEMQQGVMYEFAMVNPTPTAQRCSCQLISMTTGKILDVQVVNVPPGGSELISIKGDKSESVRLVIESRLVMARPLVFRIQNLKLDVFHG